MRLRFWTSRRETDEVAASIVNLKRYDIRCGEILVENIEPAVSNLQEEVRKLKEDCDLLEQQRTATHASIARLEGRVASLELKHGRLRQCRCGNGGGDDHDDDDFDGNGRRDHRKHDNNEHHGTNKYIGKGKGRMIDHQDTASHQTPSSSKHTNVINSTNNYVGKSKGRMIDHQHTANHQTPSSSSKHAAHANEARPLSGGLPKSLRLFNKGREDFLRWSQLEKGFHRPWNRDVVAGSSKS